LYKLRALLDDSLRLRTACDLEPACDRVEAHRPTGFVLPDAATLANALRPAIEACAHLMTVTEVRYDDELKKSKDNSDADDDAGSDDNGD
jgi:CRISPR-associated protein Csb1